MPPSPSLYVTKDSGQRVDFETGSRRDVEDGKLDFTLIPWMSLRRYVELLQRGADKYGRNNWRKGQSMARGERSLARHFAQYLAGERDEDHLAAIVFNAVLLMDHEDRLARGELPKSLDDREPV